MSHASEDRDLWSTTRIEALSDGVFAIVMTLLVLELKVPELPRTVPPEELWHAFRELGPTFFSYFVTFTLAGVFWFWHHRAFHDMTHVNGPLFALNVAFLSFVSLLPFSTAMLGAFQLRQPLSLACYFGNLLGMALILSVLWQYAQRAGLVAPTQDPVARRKFTLTMLAQVIACTAALIAVAVNTAITMNVYILVLLAINVVGQRLVGRRVALALAHETRDAKSQSLE
jgi:uncharacterized membrane protein